MTPTSPDSHKTGQRLRTETVAAVESALAFSEIPGPWTHSRLPDAPVWDSRVVEFIGAQCTTQVGDEGQRFQIQLFHEPVGDPLSFAHKMGRYWESHGYTVTSVGDIDLGPQHNTEFRADRPDGSLYADVIGSNILFSIGIYSECSTDPTLNMFAGPDGYRTFDLSERDPYHPTEPPTITPYPRP